MSWQIKQIDNEAEVVILDCPMLDWDNFPVLAELLLEGWELHLRERESGADRHSWRLAFEGSLFRLEYEHYSGCWLAAEQPVDWQVLQWLARQHKD
ncbi:MAG: DUF3630 family protein [Aeromonas sp.]